MSQNKGGDPYDQQPGSRDLEEDRNPPANHLAKSLNDLDRIKKTIDPEENKKKDPVPESMKPDQGSKTIMKLVAMALLIIGAVTLGTGFGAAIMGVLAAGAGLLAANDILGATGNAPLQSKKSKNKEEQADKMHKVEQKALDAALVSLEKNIDQINARLPMASTTVPLAESRDISAGSKIYNPNEIDEMVRNRVDYVLMQQNQTDRQIGSRDPQSYSQNPSNSGRDSPDIARQDLNGIIRSEVREALQGVVADISKGRDGRGEEGGGGQRDASRSSDSREVRRSSEERGQPLHHLAVAAARGASGGGRSGPRS